MKLTQIKKLLSLVLSVVLLLSVCITAPLTVLADESALPYQYTGFETAVIGSGSTVGSFTSSGNASIDTDKFYAGSKSLKITTAGDNNKGNEYKAYAYTGEKTVIKLEPNTDYVLSFWYLHDVGGVTFHLYHYNDTSIWSTGASYSNIGGWLNKADNWTEAKYTFNSGDCADSPYLAFSIMYKSTDARSMYFDEVKVAKVIPSTDTYTSFEDSVFGSGTTAGSFGSSSSAVISTEKSYSGIASIRFTAGSSTIKAYVYNGNKKAIKLEPNKDYTLSFYFLSTSGFNFSFYHYNDTSVWSTGSAYKENDWLSSTNGKWTKKTYEFNSGDCTNTPYLVFGTTHSTSTPVIYFDEVTLTEKPTEPDAVGTNTNTYTGFDGAVMGTTGNFASSGDASISYEKYYQGNYSLKIAPTSAAYIRAFAYNGNQTVSAIQLESNKEYEGSIWYYAKSKNDTHSFALEKIDSADVWADDGNYSQIWRTEISGNTGDWVEVKFEFESGDCSTRSYLVIAIYGNKDDVFYFDNLTVTPKAPPKATNTYTGFEDVQMGTSGNFASSSNASISKAESYKGQNSLKILMDKTQPDNWYRSYVYNGVDVVSAIMLKPNTNYTGSLYYKVSDGKNQLALESTNNVDVWKERKDVYSFGILANTGDDWTKLDFSFNSGDCSDHPYLIFAFRSNDANAIYIDEFKIETEKFDGYICDFDVDMSFYKDTNYCSDVVWNQANNILTFTPNTTDTTTDTTVPSTTSAKWLQQFTPYNGSFFQFESYTKYEVTVRYKQATPGNTERIGYLAVGTKAAADKSQQIQALCIMQATGTTNWTIAKQTFTTGALTDKFLVMTFSSSSENITYEVDYIMVRVIKLGVKTNDRGYISYKDVSVGQEIPALRSVDEANFVGWYSDPECQIEFGTVQENETRTAYAKYDSIKISFVADSNVDGLTKVSGGYALKFNATTTATQFTIPCYDAAEAGKLHVKDGKSYVVRFIYKLGAGSDAGYISVFNNKFKFDATETGTDGWAVGAIAFQDHDHEHLTFEVVSNSTSEVYIDEFIAYPITNFKTSYEVNEGANSTITNVESAFVQNNMLFGKININLADDEQIAVDGLKVTYDLYATAFSEKVTTKVIYAQNSIDLNPNKGDVMANTDGYVYAVPANAKNIHVSATFVKRTDENFGVIASSIREASASKSAGIRFRGRVYKFTGIQDNYFLIAPTKKVGNGGLTMETAESCSALVAKVTEVKYDESEYFWEYQVLLTNVDAIKDMELTVVLCVKKTDGTYLYAPAVKQSYNSFVAAAEIEHRGITSYYNEEFEETRDKLIQSSNDGSFSFIMLSDTHIDYKEWSLGGNIQKYYVNTNPYKEKPVIERTIQAVIEMANTSDVDCIVLGGDLIHGTESRDSALADLHYIVDMFKKAKVPVYVNKGNHDNNDYPIVDTPEISKLIQIDTWNEDVAMPLAMNTEVRNEKITESGYYYVDFPEKKTRLIVLDSNTYPVKDLGNGTTEWNAEEWSKIEDAQLKWFATVALDTEKDGWSYVISAHAPIYGGESFKNAAVVQDIISAFNNKTTITVDGAVFNFTDAKSSIHYSLSGHTHVSSWRLGDNGNHLAVNTTSGRVANYPTYNYADSATKKEYYVERYENQASEAAFDAIVVNSNATVINRFAFGAHPDNKFTLGDSGYTVETSTSKD